MGQEYQLLHIESEQPPSPRLAVKRKLVVGVAVLSVVAVLLTALSLALASHLHSHNLEVLSDNTPASKRGAGLLLTYATKYLSCLVPNHLCSATCCSTVWFDQVCSSCLVWLNSPLSMHAYTPGELLNIITRNYTELRCDLQFRQ